MDVWVASRKLGNTMLWVGGGVCLYRGGENQYMCGGGRGWVRGGEGKGICPNAHNSPEAQNVGS